MSAREATKVTKPKTLRELVDEVGEPKTVREWLFDYFATIDGTEMAKILADIAPREVGSFTEARTQVNCRIDAWLHWLQGTRPSPSPVYEPEAWEAWVAQRKAQGSGGGS
jgi:hypothetical protein